MPLSFTERDRVYERQVELHAVKRCDMCSLLLPVYEFGHYGTQPCLECHRELVRAAKSLWKNRS